MSTLKGNENMQQTGKFPNSRKRLEYIIKVLFVLVLCSLSVRYIGDKLRLTPSNGTVQESQSTQFARPKQENWEPLFLKNVSHLAVKVGEFEVIEMAPEMALKRIQLQEQPFDFMWQDAMETVDNEDDEVKSDVIKLFPYYNTDNLDDFYQTYSNIDDMREYISRFGYHNDTDTFKYGHNKVMSGEGNCVSMSVYFTGWLERYIHDSPMNKNQPSIFTNVGKSSIGTVTCKFIRTHNHVFPEVSVHLGDETLRYNLDIAEGIGEFNRLLDRLQEYEYYFREGVNYVVD